MRCPFCGAKDSKVVDSRLATDANQVRRRRECMECSVRFTTYESAELNLPRVVKSRGNREPFSEEKLYRSFQKALEKRPVSVEAVDAAVNQVKHNCLIAGERELGSRQVGEWVMEQLRGLDQVAYIRFASVYRSFEDMNAFREVIEKLEKDPTSDEFSDQLPLLKEEN